MYKAPIRVGQVCILRLTIHHNTGQYVTISHNTTCNTRSCCGVSVAKVLLIGRKTQGDQDEGLSAGLSVFTVTPMMGTFPPQSEMDFEVVFR